MKISRKLWLLLGLLSCSFAVMLVTGATRRPQSNSKQQKRTRVLKAERELNPNGQDNASAPKRKTLREIGQERDIEVSVPNLEFNNEYSNLSSLAKDSTVTVLGQITKEESSFDGDDHIITTYAVDVQRVLKDTTSSVPLGPKDAPPLPITPSLKFVRPGGVMNVNGHHVSQKLNGSELLKEGKQYVLFLRWSPAFKSYHIMGGSSGAFLVKGERIAPLGSAKEFKLKHSGTDLETFIGEVLNVQY